MNYKERKANKCDTVDCVWSCYKCGFNPEVKAKRLKKRFPNFVEQKRDKMED